MVPITPVKDVMRAHTPKENANDIGNPTLGPINPQSTQHTSYTLEPGQGHREH